MPHPDPEEAAHDRLISRLLDAALMVMVGALVAVGVWMVVRPTT